MEKYIIYTRYEWYSNSGITFTKWHPCIFSPIKDMPDDKELLEYKEKVIENSKSIDKITKRASEYKIDKYDYDESKIFTKIDKTHEKKKKQKH